MTILKLVAADVILEHYGANLTLLDRDAPIVLSRALNHEGAKAFTQVRNALVRVTGIKRDQVAKSLKPARATPSLLTYILEQKGGETNLNLFNARQVEAGVSATPWGKRQIFPHAFLIAKYGNKVFIRTGKDRWPFRQLFGPNLAREVVKGEPALVFETVMATGLPDRVGHEIDFLLRSGK